MNTGLQNFVSSSSLRGMCVAAAAIICNNAKSLRKTEVKMSSEKSQNLQDVFLNNIRKNKTSVTVFLVNGVKLQGIVTWFDNFSVLLRRDNHSQLVYKHAISTVMPTTPIQLFEPEQE
jgi:host factor-I protein